MSETVRIDKWLWAARFFKTRTLAADAVERGRVTLNGDRCKTSRNLNPGDLLDIDNGSSEWQIRVIGLSDQRGSAPIARQLYEETSDSILRREQQTEQRKLFTEPAEAIRGRPTKRDRRLLDRSK
ncbi:MAG: RNA-binding S4 domain-containing protein [Oxalobacteraceae bacterium]|jgi:ribosome-associated heat shock protein Hsp15|nr:RNA-binding S4 domain-containing protein [Oxalobacteraceae bacterium]